jgi:hypothetical protein
VVLNKRADQAILIKPKPYDDGQGWKITAERVLEPVWSCVPVLPRLLVDILHTIDREEDENETWDIWTIC